jgi:hypothetical protein
MGHSGHKPIPARKALGERWRRVAHPLNQADRDNQDGEADRLVQPEQFASDMGCWRQVHHHPGRRNCQEHQQSDDPV